jgi:hypothetical protein
MSDNVESASGKKIGMTGGRNSDIDGQFRLMGEKWEQASYWFKLSSC